MVKRLAPILIFIALNLVIFRNFIFGNLVPIPGDILIGAYFPWLDYKWGFATAVPVKNSAPSDVISLLYPWRILGMDIIKGGKLPLWDPTILLGQPLLANFQAAILNPLNLLFFIFSNHLAWSVQVFLQPILMFTSMYLFLKNLKLSKISSFLAASAFAFSGFSIVWLEYNTICFTLAIFPAVLLSVDKIVERPKLIWGFCLAVLLACQFFAGYPQISIYTVMILLLYFGYRFIMFPNKQIKQVVVLGLGLVSSLLLSAVQLIPSYELLQLSIRNLDQIAQAASIQFLPLKHLITLLIPDFFGNPATANYNSVGSYDNFAFSISAIALIFVPLAFFGGRALNSKNLIFVLILILSMVLSLDIPLSRLIINWDILGLKAAVAARLLFITDFAICVLAAVGIEESLTRRRNSLFPLAFSMAFYLGIVLGLVLILAYFGNLIHSSSSQVMNQELGRYQGYALVALRNSLLPMFSVGLLFFLFSTTEGRRVLITATFFLLSLNIIRSTDKYLSFVRSELLYPSTPLIDQLKAKMPLARFDREKAELFPSNINTYYGLKSVSGQNALALYSTNRYLSIVDNTYPTLPSRFVDLTNIRSNLYSTLDVEYLLVLNRKEKESVPDQTGQPSQYFLTSHFSNDQNFKTVRVLKNNSNLGLAWFSRKSECISNENQEAEELINPKYQPKDLIFINCPDGVSNDGSDKDQVKIQEWSADYLKAQAYTLTGNYLVFSMSVYPGWQAFVDQKPVKPLVANLALISAYVPSGVHQVELKYLPSSFSLGLKISVVTLVLWLVIIGVSYAKNKFIKL